MRKKIIYFTSVFLLFIIGIILLLDVTRDTLGIATGFPLPDARPISLIGMVFILLSVLLTVVGSRESALERKLEQMQDVMIRRELLSDALRAKKFAKKGFDVNACWDPKKSYGENERDFLDTFYRETSEEIREGYKKYKLKILKEPFDEEVSYSKDFEVFKEKGVQLIKLWNVKILRKELVPLYVEHEKPATEYPGMMTRIVYYGPETLQGKSRNFYMQARKRGEVIVAHEIVNPEAIEHPNKLREAPHIHWELENIMR